MRARILSGLSAVCLVIALSGVAFGEDAPERLDINKATQTELIKVQGIGKKTAKRILDKRAELGGAFKSMYQLKEIKGIGKATFEKLVCAFYVEEEGRLPCTVTGKASPEGAVVNLNTADIKELTTLPGIGKKKAQKILDHRRDNGFFKSPYELQNIKGFGKKTVDTLLPRLEVKLDINAARAAQFEALGFANGDRILEARQKAGGFKSVEELGKLPDIDQKVFEKVKDLLFVKTEAPAPKEPAPKD